MKSATAINDGTGAVETREMRQGTALSALLHIAVLAAFVFLFRSPFSADIVAAGEGEGGGGGTAIEVGVVSASQLGFKKPEPVAFVGEKEEEANNKEVVTRRPDPPRDAEVLPRNNKQPDKPKAAEKPVTTERPTAKQDEKLHTKEPQAGRSPNTTVTVGRSFGSPMPTVSGGIGVGNSGASAGPNGVPGGSEYGRRIQMILGRNYNPPQVQQANDTHFVIIRLRIARDGTILSLAGGRVGSGYIQKTSPFDLVNRAAERAIIASNPLPPFPSGFLTGAQEATAEIWFRYPK
jgi:outer membrane biosynthesis protein TonB